jgi:hypothetical protein
MNLFITLLENVNKSRTSANNVSLRTLLFPVFYKKIALVFLSTKGGDILYQQNNEPSGSSELTIKYN